MGIKEFINSCNLVHYRMFVENYFVGMQEKEAKEKVKELGISYNTFPFLRWYDERRIRFVVNDGIVEDIKYG